ncbi:proline--tRNA ligase [Ruminococcaceae bacterium OttesenSCG-928-O06]|nr:proline--tRNA ligase [Ruminococcaceae bacterium OttesenSCG-928-O06]
MSENKKMVEAITPQGEDFAQWYTDICLKAELVDYSSVKGFTILRPYGQAIWENITRIFDGMIKASGHENVAMPLLIPESLLQKEKDHVKGFGPEVAWVTKGGSEELEEPLCIRPTSETLFCDHFARVLHSWRQLPFLYNQWCSVVRWEKTTRPFLRSREFWWQEGHTIHETAEEAKEETLRILDYYTDLCENHLMMPLVRGPKTESDKFAGAEDTYAIEAMMHDGKVLQAGTSHYFGDGFSRAFDVTFTGRDNTLQYPFETSWGISTRLIGGIIMTHGDDNGLALPPAVAPWQVVIVPVAQHKEGVLEKARELRESLAKFCRVKLDESDNSPGWKFSEWEMKGVPLRLEIGPKDIEKDQCVLVRRDSREKAFTPLADLDTAIPALLGEVADALYQRAAANLTRRSFYCASMDEVRRTAESETGFIFAMWCGEEACEDAMKEQTGYSSQCIPFEQKQLSDVCPICGKPAKHMVAWGKAY